MWTSILLGFGFGFLFIAFCISHTTPPVQYHHGGKDTNNLMVALGFVAAGVACLIVGSIIGGLQWAS